MTCDEFKMEYGYALFTDTHEWKINVRDGETRIFFRVYDEKFQECLKDNYDYVVDTIAAEITHRVMNLYDDGKISEDEKNIFNMVMLQVIG